jgi:hypothetical protein
MKGVRCSTKWGQRHIHWWQKHDVTHLFWLLVSLLFPANSCHPNKVSYWQQSICDHLSCLLIHTKSDWGHHDHGWRWAQHHVFFVSCAWVTKCNEWALAILVKCFKSKVLSKLFIKSFYFIQWWRSSLLFFMFERSWLKEEVALDILIDMKDDTVLLYVRSFLLLLQCYNRRPTYCIA